MSATTCRQISCIFYTQKLWQLSWKAIQCRQILYPCASLTFSEHFAQPIGNFLPILIQKWWPLRSVYIRWENLLGGGGGWVRGCWPQMMAGGSCLFPNLCFLTRQMPKGLELPGAPPPGPPPGGSPLHPIGGICRPPNPPAPVALATLTHLLPILLSPRMFTDF